MSGIEVFVGRVSGFLSNPGVWIVVFVVGVFLFLLLNKDMGVLAAFIVVFALMALMRWVAPEAVKAFNGGVAASNQAWNETCGLAGTCVEGIHTGSYTAATQPYVNYSTQEAPTPVPQVIRTWNREALTKLSAGWNLLPGDWPSKTTGQLVSPASLPQGVKAGFVCNNCKFLTGKADERWTVTLIDTKGNSDQVSMEVNGFFARDSKGFNANPAGSESSGTGSWEVLCPSGCFTDTVIVPTPTPVKYPFFFSAKTILVNGQKTDVCGWKDQSSLVLCNDSDQPGAESIVVDPNAYQNLPRP